MSAVFTQSGSWPACPTRHAQACLPPPQPQAELLPHILRGPGTHGQIHTTSNPAPARPRLPPQPPPPPQGVPAPGSQARETKALEKLAPGRDANKTRAFQRVSEIGSGPSMVKAKDKSSLIKSGKWEKIAGSTRTLGGAEERQG